MKLEKFLQDNYNYNPEIKDNIKTYIEQWKSWYAGNVKDFHNYEIYNGQQNVKVRRFTLNMAKEISEDWADILWSEKCEISLKNEESQKQFDELIDNLDLYTTITQLIEKSGALGTEMAVVSAYDIIKNEDGMTLDVSNAKTRVNIVDIDWIFPLSWDNTGITECAFGSVQYIKGQKYIVLSVHKLNDAGNYVIYNHLFSETNGNLTEVLGQEGTENEFDTKSNVKWFATFKPLLTNNLFENNPFGIPHYANAIDVIKAVDIDFDAFKNEVKDGVRRTFVRAEMLNYDNGEQKLTFNPNETNIYVLPKGATKDDLIQSDTDNLRVNEQIEALNTSLNILGNKVGFENDHYKYDGAKLQTATAVIASNSKMFRRKKKLEIGYEAAIYDLAKAICYVSSTFGKYNINTDDMVVKFDDGVLEDTESIANRAMREVNAGLLSRVEYRTKVFRRNRRSGKTKNKTNR